MFYNSVNGSLFKGIVLNGYNNLIRDMAEINNLNVFPVPDGDTGTNMKKTLENGINNLTFNDGVEEQIGEVSDILAKGMLLGARGNSGVILSQYFKGIAKHLVNKNVATVNDMVEAFIEGYKTAYNAVVTPTEGTILTVAREGIELVKNQVTDKTSFNELLDLMYKRMEQSLEETPEKLFVLKEAGVVDSGGAGLISIFKGMICYLNGEKIDVTSPIPTVDETTYDEVKKVQSDSNGILLETDIVNDLQSNEKDMLNKQTTSNSKLDQIVPLDINLYSVDENGESTKITSLNSPITINMYLPDDIVDSIKNKTIKVARFHGGVLSMLDASLNGNILTFKTDKFSTYAIVAYGAVTPTSNVADKKAGPKNLNSDGIITCDEEMGSKNWIWSETKGACVYKVSNTSVK